MLTSIKILMPVLTITENAGTECYDIANLDCSHPTIGVATG